MSNARSLAFSIANSVSNAHLYKNIFLATVAGKRQKYSLPKIGLTCTTPPFLLPRIGRVRRCQPTARLFLLGEI